MGDDAEAGSLLGAGISPPRLRAQGEIRWSSFESRFSEIWRISSTLVVLHRVEMTTVHLAKVGAEINSGKKYPVLGSAVKDTPVVMLLLAVFSLHLELRNIRILH